MSSVEVPSLSIIIPAYQNKAQLQRCLASLSLAVSATLNLSDPEVIIVDNNSTPPLSGEVSLKELSFQPTLITETTRGPAAARNSGVRNSTGQILVFIDSDTEVADNYLTRGLELASDLPSYQMAGGAIVMRSHTNNWTTQFDKHSLDQQSLIANSQFAATANFWVHRSLFEAVGGFDESLAICEDYEFCRRARIAHNAEVVFWPEVKVFHETQSSPRRFLVRLYRNCLAELVTRRLEGQTLPEALLRGVIAHTFIEPLRIIKSYSKRKTEHPVSQILLRMTRTPLLVVATAHLLFARTHIESTLKRLMAR